MANPYGIPDSEYNAIVASIKNRMDVVKKNAAQDLEAGRGVSLINDRVVYYDPESDNKLYGVTRHATKKNEPVYIQSSGRFYKENMGFKAGVTFYVGTHGRIITDPTGLTNKTPVGTGIDENSIIINFGEDKTGLLEETDPIFTSHVAYGITAGDITNWDIAYGFSQQFDLFGAVHGDIIRFDSVSGKWIVAAASTLTPDWADITGKPNSGNFIYNQYTSAQSASFWITGNAKINGDNSSFISEYGILVNTAGRITMRNSAGGVAGQLFAEVYNSGSWSSVNAVLQIGTSGANIVQIGNKLTVDSTGVKVFYPTGTPATGDVFYVNASGYMSKLAAGTNGQVLKLSAGLPSWQNESGISGITADNGLTANTSTNVRLGGSLSQHTNITGSSGTYNLSIYDLNTFYVGTDADVNLETIASGLTGGIQIFNNKVDLYVSNSETSSVSTVSNLFQYTSGIAAVGLGISQDFSLPDSGGTQRLANRLISKWTTATSGSQTSQFIITGVNSGTTGDILTLFGNKSIRANGYGSNTFTGTLTRLAGFTASGDVIEVDPAGLSGGSVAWTDITSKPNSGNFIYASPASIQSANIHIDGSVTFGSYLYNPYNNFVMSAEGGSGMFFITNNDGRIFQFSPNSTIRFQISNETATFGYNAKVTGTFGVTSDSYIDGRLGVGNVPQDNTETKVLVWNSTDKQIEYRDASTLTGSSVTFGTDNQIPFVNSGGTDFEYSSNLTYDGTTLAAQRVNASTDNGFYINGSQRFFDVPGALTSRISPYQNKLEVYNGAQDGYILIYNTGGSRGLELRTVSNDAYIAALYAQKLKIQGNGGETEIGGLVTLIEQSAPSTPASGYGHLYPKTDGKLYWKDDAGNEFDLTATGGGVSFGTDNQIPFTNSGGTDFDYSANFTYDGTKVLLKPAANNNDNIFQIDHFSGYNLYNFRQNGAYFRMGGGVLELYDGTLLLNNGEYIKYKNTSASVGRIFGVDGANNVVLGDLDGSFGEFQFRVGSNDNKMSLNASGQMKLFYAPNTYSTGSRKMIVRNVTSGMIEQEDAPSGANFIINGTSVQASANYNISGSGTLSNLNVNSGGAINFNSGDVTITHGSNTLAFAGATSHYTFDNSIIVSKTMSDGTQGDHAIIGFETHNWTANTTQNAGAVYAALASVQAFNYGSSITINAATVHSAAYFDLKLGSSVNSTVTVQQAGGGSKRAVSTNAIMVQLETVTGGAVSTIDHVAGIQIFAPLAGGGSGVSSASLIGITNYYALLIAPHDEYSNVDAKITNAYAIYQAGANDMNVFASVLNSFGHTNAPTATLDISGTFGYNQLRLRTSYTPSGPDDTNGNLGDVAWDSNFFYVKTVAGWCRTSLSLW